MRLKATELGVVVVVMFNEGLTKCDMGSHDKTWKQERKDTKEVRVRRKFGSVPVGFGLRHLEKK